MSRLNIQSHFVILLPGVCVCVCLSVCLSVTQLCPLYSLKTVKSFFTRLHTQISNIRLYAESKNSKSGMSNFQLFSYGTLKLWEEESWFLKGHCG